MYAGVERKKAGLEKGVVRAAPANTGRSVVRTTVARAKLMARKRGGDLGVGETNWRRTDRAVAEFRESRGRAIVARGPRDGMRESELQSRGEGPSRNFC